MILTFKESVYLKAKIGPQSGLVSLNLLAEQHKTLSSELYRTNHTSPQTDVERSRGDESAHHELPTSLKRHSCRFQLSYECSPKVSVGSFSHFLCQVHKLGTGTL
jgi:hypothetical protein